MDEHIPQPALVQFATRALPDDAAEALFGHLAFCGACRTRLEAIRELTRESDPISSTLASQTEEPVTSSRVPCPAGVWASLRIVMDRARGIGGIAIDDLRSLATSPSGLRIKPIVRTTGVGDAMRLDEPTPGDLYVELKLDGPAVGSASIIADPARGSVAVLLRPPDGITPLRLHEDRKPRAALVDDEGRRHQEGPLVPVQGAAYLLAEFEHVEDGNWTLSLEFGP